MFSDNILRYKLWLAVFGVLPSPSKSLLLKSGVIGTVGVFAQTIDPSSGALERLGTAGILVVAAYYMLKYFMVELVKRDALAEIARKENLVEIANKDAQISLLTAQYLSQLQTMSKSYLDQVITELRESQAVKEKLNSTLHELTQAVKLRHDNPLGVGERK